jgi:hypothetical protein
VVEFFTSVARIYSDELTDHTESFEDLLSVRRIFELVGEVLASPMFVVFACEPKTRRRNIKNISFVGDPDLRLILAVSQRELSPRNNSGGTHFDVMC